MRLLLPVALLLSACGTNPTPSRSGEELCGPGTRLADGVCAPTAGADAGGAECGVGTRLVDGICVVDDAGGSAGLTCGPGTVATAGVCVPEGSACASDGDCPRGLYCVAGGCRERVCEPGARRCAAEDLELCDKDGLGWDLRRACERGCVDSACLPQECPPLAVRCDAAENLEQCDARGLAWAPHAGCDHGCVAGACRQAPAAGACSGGDRRCDGESVLACGLAGTGWPKHYGDEGNTGNPP